ncbi:O-antigen ligase family protein [Paludibacter sp. 221]|uniref:O-antigen ligase family protein n=1 Tax=Paludibacter sp. 221 TaxID=2302939 RepID=UPI0013D3D775|nr:O-antigen ligase family protein [Paludibacter sp. 221]
MVLATVFIVNTELANPVVSGKYFWFYGWIAVSSIAVVVIYFINHKKAHWQLPDVLVLFFGIVALSSSYYANRQINTKWILLLLCLVLYFYFRIVLSANKPNRYWLVLFLISTALAQGIWGLMQLYGFRISQHNLFLLTGSFFNPGPYSGYLAFITPIAFYYILADYKVLKRKPNLRFTLFYLRWLSSVATVLVVSLTLPATMSRASWLATSGGVIIAALAFFSKKYKLQTYIRQHKKKAVLIFVCLTLCCSIGSVGMYHLKKDSADGRALMWKVSLRTIPSHPLGVGLNNFSGIYGEQQAAYFASGEATEQEEFVAGAPEYAFNEYLQICIELGVFSFLLFSGAILSFIYSGYKRKNIPAISSLIALLIFAFMSYPLNLLPFVIALVFVLADCISETPKMAHKKRDSRLTYICLPASMLLVGLCLCNRYPTYQAYKDWNNLKMLYSMGHYKEAEKSYAQLYPYLNDQINFMFEYGRVLRNIGKYEESNGALKQAALIRCDPMLYNIMGQNYQDLKLYDPAEAAYIKSSNIIPNRHYPHYLLAKLYIEKGDTAKAQEKARFVIGKRPKVASPAIEEMKTEMEELLKK